MTCKSEEKLGAAKGQPDEWKSTFDPQRLQDTFRTWSSCRRQNDLKQPDSEDLSNYYSSNYIVFINIMFGLDTGRQSRVRTIRSSRPVEYIYLLPPLPSLSLEWKQTISTNYRRTVSHCSRAAGAVCSFVCVVGSSLYIVVSGIYCGDWPWLIADPFSPGCLRFGTNRIWDAGLSNRLERAWISCCCCWDRPALLHMLSRGRTRFADSMCKFQTKKIICDAWLNRVLTFSSDVITSVLQFNLHLTRVASLTHSNWMWI